jgi:hypothetical protein
LLPVTCRIRGDLLADKNSGAIRAGEGKPPQAAFFDGAERPFSNTLDISSRVWLEISKARCE